MLQRSTLRGSRHFYKQLLFKPSIAPRKSVSCLLRDSTIRHQWSEAASAAHRDPPRRTTPSPTYEAKIRMPKHLNNRPTKRTVIEVDGQPVQFDNVFLRDACRCPQCLHPTNLQKLIQTTHIQDDIYPLKAWVWNNELNIEWSAPIRGEERTDGQKGGHMSTYTEDFLRTYSSPRSIIRNNFNDFRQILWDRNTMHNDVLWVDYEEYMSSEETLFKFVQHLSLYGLAFLRNVPEGKKQNAVAELAERIGNLKTTFYGATWDVRSEEKSKNIASTSLNLGLHMDLLYFESPPGLQFLHCLKNSVTGGSSIFADAFHAANYIRTAAPSLFESLVRFPVSYHYKNDGKHYYFTRPTIILEPQSHTYHKEHPRIQHMNWSPPFQAPYGLDASGERASDSAQFRAYVLGARVLDQRVNAESSQYELTLKEGDCAVFFNRRVLHARRAFDETSGDRWLKGAYVDIDAFQSAFRVLAKKYAGRNRQNKEDEWNYLQ